MSDGEPDGSKTDRAFGSCCMELQEAIQAEDFEPLITLGPDDVLYISVGLMDLEDEDEPGMVDHPIFFCPFCGTSLQSRDEVQAKLDADIEQLA
ncbi:MAG: hypothetical protein AAFV45_02245 [Pseudomonadota bacterium]